MTCVSRNLLLEVELAFGSRISFQIFLEVCKLGTYNDVVNYVIHKSEIRRVYSRQSKKLSGSRIFCMDMNKIVRKECSDDSD